MSNRRRPMPPTAPADPGNFTSGCPEMTFPQIPRSHTDEQSTPWRAASGTVPTATTQQSARENPSQASKTNSVLIDTQGRVYPGAATAVPPGIPRRTADESVRGTYHPPLMPRDTSGNIVLRGANAEARSPAPRVYVAGANTIFPPGQGRAAALAAAVLPEYTPRPVTTYQDFLARFSPPPLSGASTRYDTPRGPVPPTIPLRQNLAADNESPGVTHQAPIDTQRGHDRMEETTDSNTSWQHVGPERPVPSATGHISTKARGQGRRLRSNVVYPPIITETPRSRGNAKPGETSGPSITPQPLRNIRTQRHAPRENTLPSTSSQRYTHRSEGHRPPRVQRETPLTSTPPGDADLRYTTRFDARVPLGLPRQPRTTQRQSNASHDITTADDSTQRPTPRYERTVPRVRRRPAAAGRQGQPHPSYQALASVSDADSSEGTRQSVHVHVRALDAEERTENVQEQVNDTSNLQGIITINVPGTITIDIPSATANETTSTATSNTPPTATSDTPLTASENRRRTAMDLQRVGMEQHRVDDFVGNHYTPPSERIRHKVKEFLSNLPNASEEDLAGNNQCDICVVEYGSKADDKETAEHAVKLPCGHIIGSSCIKRWICLKNSCPYCRGQLIKIGMPSVSTRRGDMEARIATSRASSARLASVTARQLEDIDQQRAIVESLESAARLRGITDEVEFLSRSPSADSTPSLVGTVAPLSPSEESRSRSDTSMEDVD